MTEKAKRAVRDWGAVSVALTAAGFALVTPGRRLAAMETWKASADSTMSRMEAKLDGLVRLACREKPDDAKLAGLPCKDGGEK